MATTAELLSLSLALPREEREELAERLLESVDGSADESVAQAWDREIAERLRRYDAGEEPVVAWADVQARLARKRTPDAR